jgi:pyruvate/2-oxoglutarate dehydrogenase complex dihydrolipoamide dehydrogenase (E3) component
MRAFRSRGALTIADAMSAPAPSPATPLTPDLCIIGAGSAGLSVAVAAGLLNVPTVLIERDRMGGDCLNVGCVPSKALIAAARRAVAVRGAQAFGLGETEPKPNFARIQQHVRDVIARIAPNDSEARFGALGVTVLKGSARFVDARTVMVGAQPIRARRFIVATGSRPAIPPIQGLPSVPYLTNESLFDLTRRPEHLIVLGGGPIGCEMAQAFADLGTAVTLIEAGARLLPREDQDAAGLVARALTRSGVSLRMNVSVSNVAEAGEGVRLTLADGEALSGSHLLVATGRRPAIEDLGLDAAGITATDRGIVVDQGLRTRNRRVYAIGDAAGGPLFTHVANYHAGLVVRSALFRLKVKAEYRAVPRVTFTGPELAHVGLTEDEARAAGGALRILRWPIAENDRAQAMRATDGFVKAITDRKGRILGCTIVAEQAGELITPWTLAINNGLTIRALTDVVIPYPTVSEASKRAATAFVLPRLRSPWVGRALRLLRGLG